MTTEDFLTLRTARPELWEAIAKVLMYYMILILSAMSLAMAWNFWRSNPTFNPYGIPKNLIGAIFAVLGLSHLIFLFTRKLEMLLGSLTLSLGFMVFWAISNTEQSFAGLASFQLPILLGTIALVHMPLLVGLFWLRRK